MRRELQILLASDFFIILGFGMMMPIYALFVEEIGGSILEASGAWSAFAFTSGILMYMIGRWEDKKKHYEAMLVLGFIFKSIAYLGYFFVSNTAQLFMVQIVLGLGGAIGSPSYDALYSMFLQKGKYATQWGTWEAMNMIVSAVAAIIGGLVVHTYSFKTLFLLMFVSGVCGVIIASALLIKKS